jgi:hypothetical protein
MGQAVWLFLYLILNANRHTGILVRKEATIAAQTDFNPRTIRMWLAILRDGGYITTEATGRYLRIEICLWKSIQGRQNPAYQSGKMLPPRAARYCQSDSNREAWICANLREKSEPRSPPK